MWHTSEGDRTLEGAEAALAAAAVTGIVELIREESSDFGEQLPFGISLFDSLTWTQRLAVLDVVATHLLTPTPEVLELTAVAEATVGVLFEYVRLQIDLEIDFDEGETRWRRLVLDAFEATERMHDDGAYDDASESAEDYSWGTSDVNCRDRSAWREMVETLTDQILWDRDYEMMAELADEPPEKAAFIKSYLGITDDYFAAAGPDAVSKTAVAQTLQRLARFDDIPF